MLIQLPNGLLDGVDLFNYAEVDEIRGKQQNYLADKDLIIGNIGHIPKILEDLVLSLQTKEGLRWGGNMKEGIYKLSNGDLETILVKIRQNTYGERFYYEAQCSHCDHHNKDLRLDLNALELDVMSVEEMLAKEKRTVKLPKSGKEVEFKPLYLKDLFELIKITANKTDELITSSVSIFVKRIDDKTKITSEDIQSLSALDIQYLNEQAMTIKLEGTIDTNIINECNKCKKEFETKLNVYDPAFFGPTKGYKTTNI